MKRVLLSLVSFGLIKYEDPAKIGPYVVESMKRKLADLKASAVPVIASRYRIERLLEMEQQRYAQLDADTRQAVLQNEDDLAANLLVQQENCRQRTDDLKAQLEAARRHAEEAKSQIELFQEELQEATDRARNAQMRYQLANMRAQVQKFSVRPSLDEDMRALERMEEQADQAFAEAEALGDVASVGEQSKLRQVRQSARKERAEAALEQLKAEMGLTETEKRFTKVEVRETEHPQEQVQEVRQSEQPADG